MHSGSWFEPAASSRPPALARTNFPTRPRLVAALDWQVRSGLSAVLPSFAINAEWVASIAEAAKVLAAKDVSACLCGYWLEDGTFKDLARHISPLGQKFR